LDIPSLLEPAEGGFVTPLERSGPYPRSAPGLGKHLLSGRIWINAPFRVWMLGRWICRAASLAVLSVLLLVTVGVNRSLA